MEVSGVKKPLGINVEFDIFSLVIERLISETNILLV
jgi:hypothetical protein